MCGILAVVVPGDENPIDLIRIMGAWTQHRGQEGVGIGLTNGGLIIAEKWEGLVKDFGPVQRERLTIENGPPAMAAIAHLRYSNTGGNIRANLQPFIHLTMFGRTALVHNGNLTNIEEVEGFLREKGYEPEGTTDSELIILLISYYSRLDYVNSIEEAIKETSNHLKGSYSLLVMTKDRIIGLRDPWGIRPLSFGSLNGDGFVFASETCAFRPVGAHWICDLNAGEMIVATFDGHYTKSQLLPKVCENMCIFEHIYFCKSVSVVQKRSIETARRHMGEELWQERPMAFANRGEWVVGGVPSTGIPAAMGFAAASGIEHRSIFIKNESVIERTFIEPNPRLRALGVNLKLQTLDREVEGKRVIAIDDSIVRANSSVKFVKMLKDAGAKEVHLKITSPPYMFSCNLGIATPDTGDLIAAVKGSEEEIRDYIGADSLQYLSLPGLIKAIDPVEGYGFCTGCFDQHYPYAITE